VQDTDPYWQVRAGQEWLDGTPLARPDTWSWAPVEGLFYPNSPLWNAALAIAWGAAESWGMFVLTALTIGAYFALAAHLARRLGASWTATTIAVIVTSLAALPMLSPRAGVPSQVLLLAGIAGGYAWCRRAPTVAPWISVAVVGGGGFAVSWLGNWVHLSWSTTALGLAVAWAALWLLAPGLGAGRRAALIVAGTVGLVPGIGAGPYGWSVYERARAVLEACRGLITEWVGAFHPEAIGQWALPTIVAIAVGVLGAAQVVRWLRAPQARDPRVPLLVALLVIGLPAALAGLTAVRFTGMALLTLLPVIAMLVTQAGRRIHHRAVRRHGAASRPAEYTSTRMWRIVLGGVLVAVSPFVLLYAAPHATPETIGVTDLLPRACRLFSPPKESAAVLLLRPDVTVWLDGRADYWGRDRLEEYYDVLSGDTDQRPVPEGTTCVILPDEGRPSSVSMLADALDASPDWARAAENGYVILWLPTEPSAD